MSHTGVRPLGRVGCAALRDGERFLSVTHENPDGDALGSLVAMNGMLSALGKDSVMFMRRDEFPLPRVPFLAVDGLISVPPDDFEERTIVFLDCGNIDRNPAEVRRAERNSQHRPPPRQHALRDVNHVVGRASCTAEIVWDLMARARRAPDSGHRRALYIGLVTDTGRFMYETPGPGPPDGGRADRGRLDVHELYRRALRGRPVRQARTAGAGAATSSATTTGG